MMDDLELTRMVLRGLSSNLNCPHVIKDDGWLGVHEDGLTAPLCCPENGGVISVLKEPTRSVPEEPSRSVPEEPSRSVPEEPSRSVPEEPTRSVPNEMSRSVLKEPI
nr:hypothetical protein [Tanacetum cinerariifolium]